MLNRFIDSQTPHGEREASEEVVGQEEEPSFVPDVHTARPSLSDVPTYGDLEEQKQRDETEDSEVDREASTEKVDQETPESDELYSVKNFSI
jgi:hypothetical protein